LENKYCSKPIKPPKQDDFIENLKKKLKDMFMLPLTDDEIAKLKDKKPSEL